MKNQKKQNQQINRIPKKNNHPNNRLVEGDQIWLYGRHVVLTILQQQKRKISQILLTKNALSHFESFLSTHPNLNNVKTLVRVVENEQIEHAIGNDQLHQGFAIKCSKLPIKNQFDLLSELHELDEDKLPTLLLLDQISDPHNVGAIIRSAVAFGVKKIIFLEHNSPRETATIVKSSAATIDFADLIVVTNFSNLMEKLKKIGYWCIGLDGAGTITVSEVRSYKNLAIIIGSEGFGIRDLVKKNCDALARIDIDPQVESLNASVSAAILLHEISKRNV